MAKLIEEIILKVGVDTSKLNAALAGIGKKFDGLGKKIDGVTEETEENTAANKKSLPTIKKNSIAIDDLDKKLDKSEDGWNAMTKSMVKYTAKAKKARGASSALSSALKTIAGIAAGGAALSIVTDRVTALNEAALDAERLGVMATHLMTLQEVGKEFGATADDVTQGIKNINESASEAFVDQSGEKFDLFKELKIDLEKFTKLKPDEQLEEISRSLNGVDNQGRKTAISLALMGEEGFKLSNAMKELATNGPAAKAAVQGLVSSEEEIQKMRELTKQLERMKTQLGARFTPAVGFFADAMDASFLTLDVLTGALVGYNVVQAKSIELQDIHNKRMREAEKIGREAAKVLKERREEEEKLQQAQFGRKEDHALLLKQLEKELRLNEGKGAGSIQADKDFKLRQKIAKERQNLERLEAIESKRLLDEVESDKIKKIKDTAAMGQKVLDGERLSRKKDLIARLRESGKASLAFAGEAGSVQAQILQAEVQGRDSGKLSLADKLEAEVKAEEKANNDKQLKLAEDQVELLKKIEKKTSKNNNKVRGI